MFGLTGGNWGKRFLKKQTKKNPMAAGLLKHDDLVEIHISEYTHFLDKWYTALPVICCQGY